MRILRIRRGYTTNSSGANEWVPSPDGGFWRQSATPPPASPAASATGAAQGWRGIGTVASADAGAVRSEAAVPAPRPAQDGSVATPARRQDRTTANIGDIGILAGVVILLIAGWGTIKAVLSKKKSDG